jgi:hypothetical protein
MEIPTRRRRLLSTVLALFLAIESVSAVAAVATVQRPGAAPAGTVAANAPARVVALPRTTIAAAAPRLAAASFANATAPRRPAEAPDPARIGADRTTPAAVRTRTMAVRAALPLPKAKASSHGAASGGSGGSGGASSSSVSGRNHFWFPALGINRGVSSYACSRSTPLANVVYRWGCGGRNNVYIMGHAWGVMKPLHDAYVRGRLRVGMKALYADGRGKVHTYRIKWWKLTRPTTSASWAWASQSVPSMTLQTCIGKNSEYRLMVRLVEVR